MSYYVGIQPSEINKLSTYEFLAYMKLMNKAITDRRERENDLAKSAMGISLMSSLRR